MQSSLPNLLVHREEDHIDINNNRLTFLSVSSMASSFSFSHPTFLRILSPNVASNFAHELPATPLLENISKASLSA